MTGTNTKLTAAAESYFADLGRVRASGGATGERSSYGPLANLLNTVGATLKPKVFCVGELADQGAGHPDFGLYAAKQVQRGRPREGQIPKRGVVEVKSSHEDMRAWAVREQVGRYRTRYRLVLMTNLFEFVLVGEDSAGHETTLETFRLAGSDEEFERRLQIPRAFAREVGTGLGEPEGLAAENVYVLDPCCGTGAYLAQVLRRIAANLEGQGLGALTGARVKQAALGRVFGFEIMPAPFVVAHLQAGLTMQELDAPLADVGTERPGIFLTNALATLVRKADHKPAGRVGFRHLWGQAKPAELTATAEAEPDALYEGIKPVLPLGLPFVRTAVSEDWFEWPALPDLFPVSFPGVKTSRDGFLVDVDLDRLRARVADYFDAGLSHDEVARRYPGVMKTTARFNARAVRDALLNRGGPDEAGFIRVAYRPFDYRWLYWRNIPVAVWNYKLGGYQVLKKWLSYRERDVLGRSLRPEEVQYFTHTARRIMNLILKTVSK